LIHKDQSARRDTANARPVSVSCEL